MENNIESNKYTGCGAGGAGGKQMLFDRDNLQKILLQAMKFREDTYAGNPNAGGSGSNGILYEIQEELKECPMK